MVLQKLLGRNKEVIDNSSIKYTKYDEELKDIKECLNQLQVLCVSLVKENEELKSKLHAAENRLDTQRESLLELSKRI